MSDLPIYLWAYVLVGFAIIPVVTGMIIRRGAVAAGLDRATTRTLTWAVPAGWVAWTVVVGLLAGQGAFKAGSGFAALPWLGIALALALGGWLLAARIPALAQALTAPGTPARLALPQTLRVIGGVFVAAWLLGELPAVFALPAGLGDIAVGIAAPFVARRLARGGSRAAGLWFNGLGLLDLVVAVTLGTLSRPGPQQILAVDAPGEALTLLPLVLIPATAVPLAAALHIMSIRRLRAEAGPQHQDVPPGAAVRQ